MESTKEGDKARMMKWGVWALILLTVFLGVQTMIAIKDWSAPSPAQNVVSVTGEGEVVAVPDVAAFSFTVSADANAVSEAQAAVTEKVNALTEALRTLGVEERDIKTTDYSVWPKYVYETAVCTSTYCPPGRQVPDGYTANHSVTVKVRNTADAGRALGVVGDNGATNISGISFTVDDPSEVLEEARALAIEDAREKAEALSEELDVRLGRVISFYDSTQNPPMPYGMGGDMAMLREQSSVASSPTIPQGENKVMVHVTVTYEIR